MMIMGKKALVEKAAEMFVDQLFQLNDKLKAITDIEGKMEKLKELSTTIDAVIQDVESRPFMEDAVKDLLKKLKYLTYDIEDVVDYYDTKVLKKKQRSETSLRLVRDFLSSDNQVVFNIEISGKIKAITESLDSILLQKSFLLTLPQNNIRMSEQSPYRKNHTQNVFHVIGREPEKNMIVHMLTNDDDNESSHSTLKVIAIVGMGGLGKTTLAQSVFNDSGVKAHFESSRMWTVVGAEFDPEKIMKSVLEQATNNPSVNFSEMESVRQNLEKALSGKRFLLVLDDVWNEDSSKWSVLKAALTCGARGSKILVTTRSQQVSLIMGSSNTTHQIQQLSPADCLSLFQQFAFEGQAVDQNLMKIGEKIVEKCGGVPLAVHSLGSMLLGIRDETYWSLVLKSEIWQLRDKEQKVIAVLKLSYDSLSQQSKQCFAFGSLFPKDYLIRKDELIKLWIANGFVSSEENCDAEVLGNHVFDGLVKRSFFLLPPPLAYSQVTLCTMHDLMHDLARSVSDGAYWNSYQDSVEDIRNRTYHLQIYKKLPDMTQVLRKKPSKLRTFVFLKPSLSRSLDINLLDVFSELKFLRVLDLSGCGIREIPTSIGNLTHLRYLNLYSNKIEVLPDSIILLSNLQYLDLRSNKELRELPKELGNMQNLRGLFLHENNKLTHIPCGFSRLTNLRSLPLFIASDKAGACIISELEDLKLHGEMHIKIHHDFTNYSRCGRKILKNLDLKLLFIEFNGFQGYHKDMLDDLCPNTSLKRLRITNYSSRQFPTWLIELQLPNLVEVDLRCSRGGPIPPFGNLQSLKTLHFSMHGITHLGVEFHGSRGFLSLGELYLDEMDDLEEWSESHDVDELFPLLQKLRISKCPKLKSMPRLPAIQHLEILHCSERILSCVGRLTSLSVLRVDNMHDVISLPSGCIRTLMSLTELQIIDCGQLQSLPGDEIQDLQKLHSLTIEGCTKLASLPSELEELVEMLNSVHQVYIQICDDTDNLRGISQHLHSLKQLSLCGVHYLSSICPYPTYQYRNQKLHICCCCELKSLIIAESTNNVLEELYINGIFDLSILPDWLQHLQSLRLLSIMNCPRFKRVSRVLQNLHMLKYLTIVNCNPQLESICERETGEDWPIISHIPNVYIGSSD